MLAVPMFKYYLENLVGQIWLACSNVPMSAVLKIKAMHKHRFGVENWNMLQ